MKGISEILAIILIVIIVVALIALCYSFVIGIFKIIPEKSIQQKILESKINNESFTDMFCQEQQYRTTETYECSVIRSYYGELEYCKSTCDIIKAVYDYGCKHYGDCVNYSLEECYKDCDEAYTYKTTCYNDTYKNFTTGRYFEEFTYEDPTCPMRYEIYCPKKLKWGIECFSSYFADLSTEKCNSLDFYDIVECKSQKFCWNGEKFVGD